MSLPRLLLAGTHSGCGKTTVTCALLQALKDRGLPVAAFKCGPDYLDPLFHREIIGAKSANLDLFFFSPDTARQALARQSAGCAVSLLEGVMGFYDGLGLTSPRASSYDLARVTETPVVLVVNARGASLSLLAQIHGFLGLFPDPQIRGVLLNQCAPTTYEALAPAIRSRFGGAVRPLGFLPPLPQCRLDSRHLGLVPAGEVAGLPEKLRTLARQAEKTMDLDGLLALARQAPPLPPPPPPAPPGERVRIAVAQDAAFCFRYPDSLAVLEELGAELVPFSPLAHRQLPEPIHGLYLCGGYPELHAQALSENVSLRRQIRAALTDGLPCVAECGGFLYLTQAIGPHPMVGLLPGTCFDTGRLTRFGYVTLRAKADNLLCRAGETLPAHEFHHWDCTCPGEDFTAAKPSGRQWDCVVATDTLYAGFPHLHFRASPAAAARFYHACRKEKHRHAGTS